MSFEAFLPAATGLWNFVQYVHSNIAKAYEANIFGTVYRGTSYRDRGEDLVKVTNTDTGLYTLYTLENGNWVQLEGC